MADFPISNVPRRVVYVADGVGPYAFTFEILEQTDIAVYRDDTLLTLTTDYTVTINADGTGTVTLVAAPTGATQIALVGARAIQRLSDFTTGGDFFANTVNDELDSLTIFAQQNAEAVERALSAPQTDPLSINMTLPRASVRANKYLIFDASGNPDAGDTVTDVSTVAGIAADVVVVSGISANVTSVAGNAANINTVAGINADVTTVAGSNAAVVEVADNLGVGLPVTVVSANLLGADTIGTVAGSIANVNTVGGSIASVNTVAGELGVGGDVTVVAADLAGTDTIGTVATNITDVNTVAGDIANVNEVADNLGVGLPVTVVSANLLGTDTIGTVAGSIANVNTVGGSIANVNTVAGISANVTTVAGIGTNVTTVATIASNVTTVATINASVTTVAGISSDVTAVAGDATDIGVVSANIANVNTVAGISSNVTTVATNNTNVTTVATNIVNVNTTAGSIASVNTVAGELGVGGDVTVVATDLAGTDTIGTVAGIASDVSTVASISADVTTVAGVAADVEAAALTVAPVEALLPVAFEIPNNWWDTGDRLLSGASERRIISNWQTTSLFVTEEGAWFDTFDITKLTGATNPGDTVTAFVDKSGNANDAVGESTLYATVPNPALYDNQVSSRMVVDLPYLGNNCTIGYSTDQGVTILTGVTVGGPTDILHDHYLFGYVVVDRALTAEETLRLTQYLASRRVGYVAPAEYAGAALLEDGFSLLLENDDRLDLEGVVTWPLNTL